MHICPYGAMAIFILNKISLLEPKAQNRVRSALYSRGGSGSGRGSGSGSAIRPLGGYQVKPRYPELARRLGIEGTVLVAVGTPVT
jgi:outer membrane biosynthesis protein TonB